MENTSKSGGRAFRAVPVLVTRLFLLLTLSLAFMQPATSLLGFTAVPTDFLFLALMLAWLGALATGRTRFVWDKAYWLLGAYFAAMVASALASDDPARAVPKLLTQVYLLSLAVLACNIVRTSEDLRSALSWWLLGAAAVAAVALISLIAFVIDPDSIILDYTRFHFGTLPPGSYPRLRMTFLNANMACNYLTVSLVILFIVWRLGWIARNHFLLVLAGMAIAAAFTLSPGLGGIGLAAALWMWMRKRGSGAAPVLLAAGLFVGLLFVVAMAVTPIAHPTAPFSMHVFGVELYPAGRLMIWMDALRNFLADPLLGRGIGAESVRVPYQSPSGHLQRLTDAHNTFLNIAVQCGLVGLTALLAILGYVWKRSAPFRLSAADPNTARTGLGLAFLIAFAYEGLGGSFEDARHLWVLFGLFLASGRLAEATDPPRHPG
jgi:O-antigen ligase